MHSILFQSLKDEHQGCIQGLFQLTMHLTTVYETFKNIAKCASQFPNVQGDLNTCLKLQQSKSP